MTDAERVSQLLSDAMQLLALLEQFLEECMEIMTCTSLTSGQETRSTHLIGNGSMECLSQSLTTCQTERAD